MSLESTMLLIYLFISRAYHEVLHDNIIDNQMKLSNNIHCDILTSKLEQDK